MSSSSTRRRRAVSASLFALAGARVAVAQSTSTTAVVFGTPSTTPAPANPYAGSQTFPTTVAMLIPGGTTVQLNGVLPNGGFVVTDTSANNGTAIAYKLQLAYSPADQVVAIAGPTGGAFQASNGLVSQTFEWANQGGSITGQSARYVPGSVNQAGYDAYLYIPSVFASTSQTIVVGTQGVLGAVAPNNATNNTVYYGYNASSDSNVPYTFRQVQPDISTTPVAITSTPGGLNANNQLLVQAGRFTGTSTYSAGLGQDVFEFTPAADGSATGTVTKVGLTGANYGYYNATAIGSLVNAVGAANATAYQSSTSTPIAINAAGAAIGTTNRTQVNTPATAAALTNLGTDGWLYSGAKALGTVGGTAPVGTVQVGMVGTGGAALGGYYSVQGVAGIAETSTVNGISTAGAVTGTTNVYPSNTVTNNNPGTVIGVEAWQYKPTLVGGLGLTSATATGYGTTAAGTYVQLGLTTAPTGTAVGYVGTGGLRNTTVLAANPAGNVVGTSQRYFAGATTGSGVDPWYYNGTTTSLIAPTTNAATSAYSNYVSNAGFSYATLNTTMSAGGVVAGEQMRYAPGTATAEGYDGWAYSPATNTTYVIASPAILANDPDFASAAADGTASEYFRTLITSVSDTGLVTGEFDAFSGNAYDPNATLGTYLFAWTRQAGTVILGSDSTVRGMFPGVTLNSASGSDDIDAYLGLDIYADAAGDIFGVGFATNAPTTTTEQVYEFAAAAPVPEPTALAVVAAAVVPLAGRRRRRAARR